MVTGLLLLVPLVITYLVLKLIFDFLNPILQPYVQQGLERLFGTDIPIPVLGIVTIALLVYLAGLFGTNYLGRRLVALGQAALLRIPVINTVYSVSKQLVESFSGVGPTGFSRVVLVEYPRRDTWTVGFLTGMTTREDGKPMALVYIPTSPTPQSGWLALLPLEDVYDTDLSVQTTMRMVLSGGVLTPPKISKLQRVQP